MSFKPHAIELDGGRVRLATIEDSSGLRVDWPEIGEFYFSVDVIEEDGCRLGIWSGRHYEMAITVAERTRRNLNIEEPVRDLVVGGAA